MFPVASPFIHLDTKRSQDAPSICSLSELPPSHTVLREQEQGNES